ncbi:hypothetical protein BUE80_DR006158, partial [Diplocarpon rosae]
ITSTLRPAIWAPLFVVDVVSAVNASSSRAASALAIMVEAALLFSLWLPLIYASIIFHRFCKGTQYRAVRNPQTEAPARTQDIPALGTEFQHNYARDSWFEDSRRTGVHRDRNAPQAYKIDANARRQLWWYYGLFTGCLQGKGWVLGGIHQATA